MAIDLPGGLFPKVILDDSGSVLSDWKALADFGTRIVKVDFLDTSAVTVYTVPAGRVLYITYAYINWNARATLTNENIFFYIGTTSVPILKINVHGVDNDHDTLQASYTIPLKLTAGEVLLCISSDANLDGVVGFVGYLTNT